MLFHRLTRSTSSSTQCRIHILRTSRSRLRNVTAIKLKVTTSCLNQMAPPAPYTTPLIIITVSKLRSRNPDTPSILSFITNITKHILSLHTITSLLIFHIRLVYFVFVFHSVQSKFTTTIIGELATRCISLDRNKQQHNLRKA